MKISDVKVYLPKKDKKKFKAFASVTFDDCFVVTGVRVLEKKDGGLFVSMPQKYDEKEEGYSDIVFPVTKDFREELLDAVLDAYDAKVAEAKTERRSGRR